MPSVHFLSLPSRRSADPDATLAELTTAIDLVDRGLAARVVCTNLAGVEAVASVALAHAQACGIAFRIDRGPEGRPRAVVGPRAG